MQKLNDWVTIYTSDMRWGGKIFMEKSLNYLHLTLNTAPQSWYSQSGQNRTCNINNVWEIIINAEFLWHLSPVKWKSVFKYCDLVIHIHQWCWRTAWLVFLTLNPPLLPFVLDVPYNEGCPVFCSLLDCIPGLIRTHASSSSPDITIIFSRYCQGPLESKVISDLEPLP